MDTIAVTALILSLLSGLGHFIKDVHLQKCKACCIESDCRDKKTSRSSLTPPDTPSINTPGC
jgi:hypothetical protein